MSKATTIAIPTPIEPVKIAREKLEGKREAGQIPAWLQQPITAREGDCVTLTAELETLSRRLTTKQKMLTHLQACVALATEDAHA